jgi:hypothetical protein
MRVYFQQTRVSFSKNVLRFRIITRHAREHILQSRTIQLPRIIVSNCTYCHVENNGAETFTEFISPRLSIIVDKLIDGIIPQTTSPAVNKTEIGIFNCVIRC